MSTVDVTAKPFLNSAQILDAADAENAEDAQGIRTGIAMGALAQAYVDAGADPWRVVDVLVEAATKVATDADEQLLGFAVGIRSGALMTSPAMVEVYRALCELSYDASPIASLVLWSAVEVAVPDVTGPGPKLATAVRELMRCFAFFDHGRKTIAGQRLARALGGLGGGDGGSHAGHEHHSHGV